MNAIERIEIAAIVCWSAAGVLALIGNVLLREDSTKYVGLWASCLACIMLLTGSACNIQARFWKLDVTQENRPQAEEPSP